MSQRHDSAKSIFLSALEIAPGPARQAYIAAACGENQPLFEEVESLLAHQAQADSFLESPAAADALAATVDGPGEKQLDRHIGAYKIRELIGEGGMGAVYLAEQERPLRRKVALKVIKPGMDSKAVLGRFDAERNALALMNHPNIAKVLDAGTTEEGRPFFVMELVNGIPITEYCDDQKLPIRERLRLFVDVCAAIQHAHQKGIIHRDIKPSNVLVTELDGKPIAKVIDFGVAKALNQSLTEQSVYTAFQTVIGTPLYMSPEQASFSAVDVDTRSDVYSLGVLLYELLTGTTPFTSEDLKKIAQEEVFKMIREHEPPRPSNRISSLGDTATRVSQLRRTVPDELGRSVSGDLDWIVMKALSKERGRRYDSATRFAEDVQRHLQNELVEARPPTIGYRLSRFYQRNRAAVLVAHVLCAFALVLGAVAIRSFLMETQLAERYRKELWERVLFKVMSGSSDSSNAIVEAEEGQLDSEKIETLRAIENLFAGKPYKTITALKPIFDADPKNVPAAAMLAMAYYQAGQLWEGIAFRDSVSGIKSKTDLADLDYLFLAYSSLGVDGDGPERAAEYLRRAKTPLGFLVQAEVAAWTFASSESPLESVRLAQESLRSARPYLMDTAYRVQVELEVNFFAYLIAEHMGVDSTEYLSAAQIAAQTMQSRYPEYVWGRYLCGELWSSTREFSRVEKVWHVPGNDFLTANLGIALIQQDKITESTRIASTIMDPLFRLFVFPALIQSDEGKKTLSKSYQDVVALAESRIEYREPYVLAIGKFAGIDDQELAATAREWLDSWPIENGDWSTWNRKCAEYFLDRDRGKLYDGVEKGTYWEQSLFYIGLYELADGNVERAIEYFQRLNQEVPSVVAASVWSRCLAEQLQKSQVREALQR